MHAARDVPCSFNWAWSARQPVSPPPGVDGLLGDDPYGAESAGFNCRYWAGTGLPFEYMSNRFISGLGDWNSGTPAMFCYRAAASIANGGGFWLIDRMLPDGTLQEESYRAMSAPFQFIQERLDCVRGSEHVPEIGVLHGWTHLVGPDLRYFPDADAREERGFAYRGASEMLTQWGRHFTGLGEDRLIERANDYRLLIVPEQEFLRADVAAALRDYVERGGNLLVTQAAGVEPVPEMLELAGVAADGFTEADHGYFASPGPNEPPVLQRTPFARLRLDGAQALLGYLRPVGGGARFGHGCAPPEGEGGFPAVTLHRYGRGQVACVGAPLFASYRRYYDHHLAAVALHVIDRLLPDPLVRLDGPPNVEVSAMRRGDDLLVHLVNHNARERRSNWFAAVVQFMPELRDLAVSVRTSGAPVRVLSMPGEQEPDAVESGGYLRVTVPRLHYMASLLFPGYFAAG
jgi:hypothetical protein